MSEEHSMRKILATLVVTLGCAGPAGTAAAQDPTQLPDLKGRWVGTNEAIMLGTPLHHGSDANTPRLNALEFTYTIEGQDGRRFWGTVASQRDREPILGVIGFDGKTIVAQDSDGTIQGTLVDRDTMELTYHHTGSSVVVAAIRVKRQR
jgi:hypothetical protein